jgi:hypothetical protein
MSLLRFFKKFFSPHSGKPSQENRYDHVTIKNIADGTIIQGHEAVKAHFERERELQGRYGSAIYFQVFRINLKAESIEELQGKQLIEIKVDGNFVSGEDTVEAVKDKVRTLLEKRRWLQPDEEPQANLILDEADTITLNFNQKLMQDDTLFYADNFIMLPAWVQVFLHRGTFDEVILLATKLIRSKEQEPLMAIRNTPPLPPIGEWETPKLVEELCIALREVGVKNRELPDGEDIRRAIFRVKEIYAVLEERCIGVADRVRRLSAETKWDIEGLLRDALDFPQALPYLASTPEPTCGNCGRPISRKAILGLCLPCIHLGLEQLTKGKSESHLEVCPLCGRQEKGFLVYAHGLEWMNYCRNCLEEERGRHETLR